VRVGITGHQKLDEPANWKWVATELEQFLSGVRQRLTGISCLAAGADQLFAITLLEQGGVLEVIVPFSEYDSTFSEPADRQTYLDLLQRASNVDVLMRDGTNEEAYYAAGKAMADRSDLIIAVWDGKPAEGLGGTADVVGYALHQHKRIVHINPLTHIIARL